MNEVMLKRIEAEVLTSMDPEGYNRIRVRVRTWGRESSEETSFGHEVTLRVNHLEAPFDYIWREMGESLKAAMLAARDRKEASE